MDAGNSRKKKSGAANRRWKKAKLEEEAKLKNQMSRYFVNAPGGNSSHSNSSLLPQPLSSAADNTSSSTNNIDADDVSSDSDGAASNNDGNGSSDNESGDECTSGLQNVTLQETFVVSDVEGKKISHEEKNSLCNKLPCQPSKTVLSQRRRTIGDRDRCCSEQVFKRRWKATILVDVLPCKRRVCTAFPVFFSPTRYYVVKINGGIKGKPL